MLEHILGIPTAKLPVAKAMADAACDLVYEAVVEHGIPYPTAYCDIGLAAREEWRRTAPELEPAAHRLYCYAIDLPSRIRAGLEAKAKAKRKRWWQ